MGTASQKTIYQLGIPENGIDGQIQTPGIGFYQVCVHTTNTELEWWKVEFIQLVEIDHIHLYTFTGSSIRNDNLLILAILNIDSNSIETLCANTGIMNTIVDKIFHCQKPVKPANELKLINNKGDVEALKFCEIYVYGTVIIQKVIGL